MQTLSIDIETYSDVNLSKYGVYKYAESPDFEILLFGYSADGSDVMVIDLAQDERLPQEIIETLTDDNVIKWAFNANFERACLSRHLSDLGVSLDPFHDNHPLSQECTRFLNPESWHCSMVWATTMGFRFLWKVSVPSLALRNKSSPRARSSSNTFPCPALRRRQTAVAQGSLIETIAKFEELGCTLDGSTKVKDRYTHFGNDEHRLIPAFKMTVKEAQRT